MGLQMVIESPEGRRDKHIVCPFWATWFQLSFALKLHNYVPLPRDGALASSMAKCWNNFKLSKFPPVIYRSIFLSIMESVEVQHQTRSCSVFIKHRPT